MAVERIDDPDDPRLADYRDLKDPDLRRRRGLFVAESRQLVRRLLGTPRFRVRSVLGTEAAFADLREVLGERLRLYVTGERTIRSVVGFNFHRGCIALGERGNDLDPGGLLAGRLLVVLERVTNPDNVGGVFRNAMAFGAAGVLLSPGCGDPLYRRTIRVSMGGTFRIPFAWSRDWPAALHRLREAGFAIVALTAAARVELVEFGATRAIPERVALLVGAEGEGLGAEARAAADVEVAIRMVPGDHSLNVATASAIALHHFARRAASDGVAHGGSP